MARLEIKGAAPALTLAAAITAGSTSLTATGAAGNWPTGSTFDFEVVIDRGTAKEEHILATSMTTGTPNTIGVTSRGYNGTTAVAHDPGAKIEHFASATLLNDLEDHVYTTARDDHAQYLRTDGTRAFSGVSAIVGNPVSIGGANNPGSGLTLARANHVHQIDDNFITEPKLAPNSISARVVAANAIAQAALQDDAVGRAELADGALFPEHFSPGALPAAAIADDTIIQRMLADNSVGTAEIIDLALTLAKFAANVKPVVYCTSSTRPGAPIEGQQIYETDTHRYMYWSGTAWLSLQWPSRIAAVTGPDRDVTVGATTHMTVPFTLASQRLIKIEAHVQWNYVTANANNTCSCSIGINGDGVQRFAMFDNPPVGQGQAGGDAQWNVLAAGSYTADVKAVNSSTVGAMRFTAAGRSFLVAEDWGPA